MSGKEESLFGVSPLNQKPCREQMCSLWIKIWKPHKCPDLYYEYDGYGLIHTVPWILKEKKKG
jgi:hypothetical protein